MKISPAQVGRAHAAASHATARPAPAPGGGGNGTTRLDRVDLGSGGKTHAERVAAFAEHIHRRLAGLAGADRANAARLAAAEARFEHHVQRIQDALAEGALDRAELERALANVLDLLRGELAADGAQDGASAAAMDAASGTRGEGEPAGGAASAEERADELARSVTERVAALAQSGATDEELAHLREAHTEFLASLERARDSFFGSGAVGRGGFAQIVRSALAELREDLSSLFEDVRPGPVALYGRGAGVEELGRSGPAGIDATA